MKISAASSLLLLLLLSAAPAAVAAPVAPELTIREIRYDGRLSDDEARFSVDIDAEATAKGESAAKLFEGDVAVLPSKLSRQLRITREGDHYFLVASHPGRFRLTLELVAKIRRSEPWNEISFNGPAATIAALTARADGAGMEVQLLTGTLLDSVRTDGVASVTGYLGPDRTVALRWQGKVTEVRRKALLTVDSSIQAQIAPTVIKYTSRFHYDIVQGTAARLALALPATQALTRLVGEQIRDWHTTTESNRQILSIEFIKPVEKVYDLTLYSEQAVEGGSPGGAAWSLNPPQSLEVERESGTLTLSAEDTLVEIESLAGLRQVNAPDNALIAYRFNARPFALALRLKRVQPVINVADRVRARLEEARLVVLHDLALNVEKAGIYALDLTPPPGFVVADVRGTGVEDWNLAGGAAGGAKVLRVNFSARVLGSRHLEVQLEQALKTFPDRINVGPLRVKGAERETAQIGAAPAPGIRLRTAELSGLREIPVRSLQKPAGTPAALPYEELLAYTAEQPDWSLSLASERLAPRVVADVFNLVTVGDGIVGGSATIRYGIVNQGVQEFKVRVPAFCRNVDFTGPNIRRKEVSREPGAGAGAADTNAVVWTIGLQDKAWGGYTLVVTYDYPFDPSGSGATLPVGGVHALDVERETGSVAVTAAVSLQLRAKTVSDALRRVDETELSAADRSLIARAVVLAYQYAGDQYDLAVDVKRYAEAPVLEAVADRTQITSVLTESGEMLTQASFMVKNNEKQFQGFVLPPNARLWGCYVNGQPVKPERNGDQVLVSLPRDANRDQAFAVDIMYAETNGALRSGLVKSLQLRAPRTDVPNTYAEWQLFVPPTLRLSGFGGSMNVAQGTTYELLDAWQKFLAFYVQVLRAAGGALLFIGILACLVIALVIAAVRRGWNGVLTTLVVVCILAVLGAMLLPALAKAKVRAQRISSINNLKQIGLAVRLFAEDNQGRLPASFDEMKNELGTDKITYDPESGQRYTYIGAGFSVNQLKPDSVLAYSAIVNGHCGVVFADGSAQTLSAAEFAGLAQRGLVRVATPEELAVEQQRQAVIQGQSIDRLRPRPAALPAATEARPARTVAGEDAASIAVLGAAPPALPASMAAGLRSLRIELPQTGTPFLFTKVLNINDEPLSIRARVMSVHAYQTLQMTWQVAAFLLGLLVWWWQWSHRRNSFILTLALALILGSVGSLLIQWRALHDALIIGFPVVTVAVIAFLVWRYWPRGTGPVADETAPPRPPSLDGNLPPATATLGLLLALSLAGARAAESAAPPPGPGFSIISASYTGTVNDRVALLDAAFEFSSAQPGQTVPLFGGDVAVQEFKVGKGDAELVRDGDRLAVRLESRGKVTLRVKGLVKVAGDVTKRRLTFGIPPALSSEVALVLEQADADVDFPTAISFKRELEKDRTRVEGVIGSADCVELLWTPRVKRAAEVAATVFCQNNSLVTFGGAILGVHATMDYQVTQGELRQARVRLPAGHRLLRVEGPAIRTWELRNENGAPVLVVDLLKGISPAWQLVVETEKVLDTIPVSAAVEIPHALDVKRETGLVALRSAEELGLSVESASDLQRVDAVEFTRATHRRDDAAPASPGSADPTDGLFSVFRFSQPDFALRVRAEAVQPQIEAVVRDRVRIAPEQVALSATLHYTIKRAGVFALKVALPDGYRVDRVSGTNILQQAERTTDGGRILEVTLKERTAGAYALALELSRSFATLPNTLAVAGVHPLDAAKLTGFVAVFAEPGVSVKTESFGGLTEIPAVSLPDYAAMAGSGSVLAYKFIAAEPTPAAPWSLDVSAESVEAWVRAEIVDTMALSETLVSGRALVRYDIANAPVKELRVRVPAAFRNVEISGPNIRSREQTGEVWRIELQGKIRGLYTLAVSWDQPRPAKTNALDLEGVSAEGVERETGWIAISAKAPLQVSSRTAADLQRVDPGDFPDWAGRPDVAAALAYRYVRPGYRLSLDVRRFDEADVLQALVDSARLTTVVADDGQMMTEMSLSVRNNGRQFLEVELPPGATVWSAFVAGQPVRPSRRDGRLLLPIEPSGPDDNAIPVELTYVDTNTFPRVRGAVSFASPKFDVPLKNARWELFLPPDYDYHNFAGSMSREVAAAKPASSSFSLWEYNRMEKASQESAKAEVQREVSEARRQLAGGNVREATANYNRAKGKVYAGKDEDAGVKELEKKLNTAQASNLILAQSEFALRNGAPEDALANGPAAAAQTRLQYDNQSAEQQWARLQQAQEMVVSRVQPLHINLPQRGLRYAFTQVLQTEADKPMTIRLLAASTKAVNWPKRLATVLAGFAVLWGLVALSLRATRRPV